MGKIGEDIDLAETKQSIQIATYNLLWTLSDAIDVSKDITNTKCINLKRIFKL